MPGLAPGIHVFAATSEKDVNGRDKPGHDDDEDESDRPYRSAFSPWAERIRNFWVIGTIMS